MDDLTSRAKEELRHLRGSSYFWILLVVLSVGLGIYHERLEAKVIKAYQIFYFLAVFFLFAFVVEWLERRKILGILKELIAKLESAPKE